MISAAINALSEKPNGHPYGSGQDRGDHRITEYDDSATEHVAADASAIHWIFRPQARANQKPGQRVAGRASWEETSLAPRLPLTRF